MAKAKSAPKKPTAKPARDQKPINDSASHVKTSDKNHKAVLDFVRS